MDVCGRLSSVHPRRTGEFDRVDVSDLTPTGRRLLAELRKTSLPPEARNRDGVDIIAGIPELIERGKKFTYENFSNKGPHG